MTKMKGAYKVSKNHRSRKMNNPTAMMIGSETSIFNRKQIIDKQNKLKKLYELHKNNPKIQFCDYIKYNYTLYTLGQWIELYSLDPTETYIAKLSKIIHFPEEMEIEPRAFIEVERVLKKNQLPPLLLEQYGQIISNAELFPTDEKIYLYVGSIKCKSTVVSEDIYGQLYLTCQGIFFSRANYDADTKTLIPNPSEWKNDCICHKPTNPDLQYVACSKCQKWFHSECVESKIINGHFMCDVCFASPE